MSLTPNQHAVFDALNTVLTNLQSLKAAADTAKAMCDSKGAQQASLECAALIALLPSQIAVFQEEVAIYNDVDREG